MSLRLQLGGKPAVEDTTRSSDRILNRRHDTTLARADVLRCSQIRPAIGKTAGTNP